MVGGAWLQDGTPALHFRQSALLIVQEPGASLLLPESARTSVTGGPSLEGICHHPVMTLELPQSSCEDRGPAAPVARGVGAPWSRGGLLEVSKTTAAMASVHPKTGEPSSSTGPTGGCPMGDIHQVRCKAISYSWCCTSASCGKTLNKHSPAPTLVLQFPLLQLGLDLV